MNTATNVTKTSSSELRQLVESQLRILLEQKNYEGAKSLLVRVLPVDIAEAIESLPVGLQVIAFRLLPKSKAIEVYEYLSSSVQHSLIEKFKEDEVTAIVDHMSPDDRARLFDELPPRVVRHILSQLSPEERQATSLLLGYRAGTAGRIMTPEYIALKENLTATHAQEKIREKAGESEVGYYLYVVDETKRLQGILSLRDLILALPEQTLQEIMNQELIYADTDTDQKKVAQLIQRYDLLALPIVDKERNLLGVVTVDDVLDIIQEETTEDIYTMNAVRSDRDNYFESSWFTTIKRRIPWLMILLVTNVGTVFAMKNYEEVLDQVVELAFFTPLLIDMGGNVGAQSSTVIIRGLGTDELRNRKPTVVILSELFTGAGLGIIIGVVTLAMVILFLGVPKIGITVGISLVMIALIAAATGAALPFLFHSLGFDPALMSAPFITTIVDILGILLYLSIAKVLLGI